MSRHLKDIANLDGVIVRVVTTERIEPLFKFFQLHPLLHVTIRLDKNIKKGAGRVAPTTSRRTQAEF
jgi:hypothetical protein